ncbi:hypothetical protein B0H13DRAFT_1857442 [Mycena leptocephala]|nr:hypothetical protein B0H13DRAFT_1857442 [Mycena leptocephala]
MFPWVAKPKDPSVIWGAKLAIEETIGTQRTLLSRITSDTAISGFYGPGAWWAWLITLGTTHGHTGMALLMKGNLLDEWDYDLIGATGYIIAASIDLIKKSRVIAELGDAAGESPLLPALVCAERAVAIGAGSSIFSLLTSLIGWPNARRSGIGLTALIFTLVASFSALRAHEIISNSTPVLWCRVHNGVELGKRGSAPRLPTTRNFRAFERHWFLIGLWRLDGRGFKT